MIKYKKEKTPSGIIDYLKLLQDMGEQDYIWQQDKFGFSIFYKQVKNTKKTLTEKEFPEWLEFIEFYRTINKNGSYDKNLIRKYKIKLEEGNKHSAIMGNLQKYKLHLEAFKSKPPLQVGTYLNQNRFKDEWKLEKEFYAKKWRLDMLKEQGVGEYHKKVIELEAETWIKTHKDKELTTAIYQRIIDKYFIRKNEV